MLEVGDRIPSAATVWTIDGEQTTLGDVLAGDRAVLLCFYPFDWSPG
jgi:peroxiredoxin